jgi:hypothetical protein
MAKGAVGNGTKITIIPLIYDNSTLEFRRPREDTAAYRGCREIEDDQVVDSLAPARSALAGLWLRRIPFAVSQAAQVH